MFRFIGRVFRNFKSGFFFFSHVLDEFRGVCIECFMLYIFVYLQKFLIKPVEVVWGKYFDKRFVSFSVSFYESKKYFIQNKLGRTLVGTFVFYFWVLWKDLPFLAQIYFFGLFFVMIYPDPDNVVLFMPSTLDAYSSNILNTCGIMYYCANVDIGPFEHFFHHRFFDLDSALLFGFFEGFLYKYPDIDAMPFGMFCRAVIYDYLETKTNIGVINYAQFVTTLPIFLFGAFVFFMLFFIVICYFYFEVFLPWFRGVCETIRVGFLFVKEEPFYRFLSSEGYLDRYTSLSFRSIGLNNDILHSRYRVFKFRFLFFFDSNRFLKELFLKYFCYYKQYNMFLFENYVFLLQVSLCKIIKDSYPRYGKKCVYFLGSSNGTGHILDSIEKEGVLAYSFVYSKYFYRSLICFFFKYYKYVDIFRYRKNDLDYLFIHEHLRDTLTYDIHLNFLDIDSEDYFVDEFTKACVATFEFGGLSCDKRNLCAGMLKNLMRAKKSRTSLKGSFFFNTESKVASACSSGTFIKIGCFLDNFDIQNPVPKFLAEFFLLYCCYYRVSVSSGEEIKHLIESLGDSGSVTV